MAVSYPDVIGEYIANPERFAAGGLQYAGYFAPSQIAPNQIANLYLFLQNNLSGQVTANLKINVPQTRGFLRGGKDLLKAGTAAIEINLAAGEVGLLTLPVTTTEHIRNGEQSLVVEAKATAEKGANRVRPTKAQSALDDILIDSPVGLNLVSSLGSNYFEKSVRKARFTIQVDGEPHPVSDAPNLNHNYEVIWQAEDAKNFNQAVKELNLRQVKMKDELKIEALYANLYGETTIRFAEAGLPLRIGEAIILAKILTYSCQYFLSSPERRNGLLVPMWEQAFREEANTTDSLDIIRTVGYHHLLKLSVAISFGVINQAFGRHFWSLEERQAVANHIADSIETSQELDIEFLYLPLLMAGTQISRKLKLKGENVDHTLALITKARKERAELFADKDLAQADKVYYHILKKA